MQRSQWDVVNFSTPESIKGLLKFRWKFDLLYKREPSGIYESNCDLAVHDENIICTYADLDYLLERADMSKKQWEVTSLYMDGYTETEIAEELGDDVRNVVGIIRSVCNKLCDTNFGIWKNDFIYWSKVKVKTNYKQCTRCEQWLPTTEEYFYREKTTKDGFRLECIKCFNEKYNK